MYIILSLLVDVDVTQLSFSNRLWLASVSFVRSAKKNSQIMLGIIGMYVSISTLAALFSVTIFMPGVLDLGLDGDVPMHPADDVRQQAGAGIGRQLSTDAQTNKLLVLIVKLLLSTTQTARALKSILLDVIKVPVEDPLTIALMDAGKKHRQKVDKLSPEQRRELGPAHIHRWNAILTHMSATYPDLQQDIAAYAVLVNTRKQITDQVKFCRLSSAWGKTSKKLEVNCLPGSPSYTLWQKIRDVLIAQAKYHDLPGQAPEGDMEKKLQHFLESSTA